MNSQLDWILALRNLKRNPRRTISTGLAIVIAYVGLTLLAGHIFNIEYAAKIPLIYGNGTGHVSIYKKGGLDGFDLEPARYYLTSDELEAISKTLEPIAARIDTTGTHLSTQALLSVGSRSIPVFIRGVQPEIDDFSRNHPRVQKHAPEFVALQSGQSFSKSSKETIDAISISQGVGEILGYKADVSTLAATERQIVLAGRTFEGDLNAVNGTVSLKHSTGTPILEDSSVIAPIEIVRDLLQTRGASHQVLFLKNDSDMSFVVDYLQSAFERAGLDLEAFPFTDDRIGLFYNGTMSFLYAMGSFFAILIFGASGLIIINSMTISVLERTKEMGTLRAIGFPPDRVKSLFVKEACLLALGASLLGLVISEFLAVLISSAGWTVESAGTTYSVLIKILTKPWLHAGLTLAMIAIAAVCSGWLVKRKVKERVAALLID